VLLLLLLLGKRCGISLLGSHPLLQRGRLLLLQQLLQVF
jgi:hypothetical protein